MNKNILILSVLMALSPALQADSGSDKQVDPALARAAAPAAAPPAAPAAVPATGTTATAQAAPATVQTAPAAAATTAPPAAGATAAAASPAPAAAAAPVGESVTLVNGRVVKKNATGELQAYICESGTACVTETLVTKNLSDLEAIKKELDALTAKKATTPKVEFDVKGYEDTLLADLKDSVLDECDLEESSGRSGRASRRSRDRDRDEDDDVRESRSGIQIQSAQWSGLELPQSDTRAECAVTELEDKLSTLAKDLSDEADALGLDGDKLDKLPRVISELNRKIAAEKDAKKKAQLELALAKVKVLDEKVTATQKVARDFARRNVLRRAESDLANRAGYGFTYLHEMSSTTPELFKSVRRDAAKSVLEVYRKQAQAHVALRDEASRTTDAAQKLQLQQESIRFGTLATNYNNFMTYRHPQTGKSAGQSLLEKYSADADLNSRAVVQDVYGAYSPAAAQISNYLVASASGGTQGTTAIPGVLSVNGSDVVVPPQPGQAGTVGTGRGRRIQTGAVNANGTRAGQAAGQVITRGALPNQAVPPRPR